MKRRGEAKCFSRMGKSICIRRVDKVDKYGNLKKSNILNVRSIWQNLIQKAVINQKTEQKVKIKICCIRKQKNYCRKCAFSLEISKKFCILCNFEFFQNFISSVCSKFTIPLNLKVNKQNHFKKLLGYKHLIG